MEKTIKEIREFMAEVEESWLANDGGLTMAACDLLDFGNNVIRHIQANDTAWIWEIDPFSADTGTEGEIINIAQCWARKKIRRQIEDRLRKDGRFFETVVALANDRLIPTIFAKESAGLCNTCGNVGVDIQAWVDGQPMSTVANHFHCPTCDK